MKIGLWIAAIALLTACAQQTSKVSATRAHAEDTSGPQQGNRFAPLVPLVDHHQHLLSPAGAKLVNTPLSPEIPLPREIAALLTARAQSWNDVDHLTNLYHPRAAILDPGSSPGWIEGGSQAADYIRSRFDSAYRLTPVLLRIRDDSAHVGGYYTRGDAEATTHFGFFSMNLLKEKGVWRITSETPVFPGPPAEQVVDADKMVALLDEAGIKRAVILSDAYYFDTPRQPSADPYAKVRAENDWTAAQVARHPGRLVAFCGLNPLSAYAVEELERCSTIRQFVGLKLQFNTSGVDVRKPEHVVKLRRVFAAANRLHLPILAHLSTGRDYGREQANIFVTEVLPAAPNVPVVVAHLWGGGGFSGDALAVFADAVSARHPATANLYFELAQASMVASDSKADLQTIAERIRQIGIERIFYGSDGPQFGGLSPNAAWADFRVKVPLSEAEIQTIAQNVAPFLR